LEQSYKIDEHQVQSLDELENMLSTPFLLSVLERFGAMSKDFSEAFQKRYIKPNQA
jgi:hypothetical protein